MFQNRKKRIITGIPPMRLNAHNTLTRADIKANLPIEKNQSPLLMAIRYKKVLEEPSVCTLSQVAIRFGVSRARVSQVLNLLNLDEAIQRYLLNIEDPKEHNFFTERRLRPIAMIEDKVAQKLFFKKLIQKEKEHYNCF